MPIKITCDRCTKEITRKNKNLNSIEEGFEKCWCERCENDWCIILKEYSKKKKKEMETLKEAFMKNL